MLLRVKPHIGRGPNVPEGLGRDLDLFALALLAVLGVFLWTSTVLAVSLLLVTMAGAIALWRPVAAGLSICLSLPFVARPVSIGDATFSLLEIATLLAFAAVVAHVLVRATSGVQRGISNWRRPLAVLVFGGTALVLAGMLSFAFMPLSTHRDEALRLFRWTIAEPLMIFVVITYAIAQRGARLVVSVIVSTATLVALMAIGMLIVDPDRFRGDGVSRALFPYLHPNNLALYLERAGVLLAAAMLFGAIRIGSWSVLALGVMSLGTLATFSRGMLPAVIAGLLLSAWLARNRRLAFGSLIALAGTVLVFVVFASDRFLGGPGDSFIGERRYVWNAAAKMIADYPVSGIGLDQFLYHHAPRYIAPEAWSERYLSHPHNVFLDSWLSLGLPGIVILSGGIVLLIREVTAWRQADAAVPAVPAAAAAAIVTGLVHGLVDNAYFLPDLAAFTWILIALIMAPTTDVFRQVSPET